MQIKHRFSGEVLFEYDCDSLQSCVEIAIKGDANLSDASLCGVNLRGVKLYGAKLYGANLSGANLSDANLSDANLRGAKLYGANLSDANLYGANLSDADLRDANLYDANLYDANLRGANLCGANLYGVKSLHRQRIVPSEGAFVGWKKLRQGIIAKVVIPHDVPRVNAYGSRKCRAAKVFVDEMYHPNGSVFKDVGIGYYDNITRYITGEETIADSFDFDPRIECSHGIHFFITREEAEEYQ